MSVNGMHANRESSEPLSVGIVGAGDIVRAVHLPVLLASSVARVAWVADIDRERARTIGTAYKVAAETIPADLAQLPEADVYLLAIPFGVRRPYYEALQNRDCAIYVEKPFAVEMEQHREICDWFPNYSLASGLMMRCWGPNVAVRNLIQSQMFGRLRTVRFGYGHPGMVTSGRYYLDRSRGGGGILGELAIHGIDAALFVSGARSACVERLSLARDGNFEVHTEAQLSLQTNAEQSVACEITVSALKDTIEGIEFEFEDAIISYPLPGQGYALLGEQVDLMPVVRPRRGGEPFHLLPLAGEFYPSTRAQMFNEYWKLFLDGVREQHSNVTSAACSMLTTEVIENLANTRAVAGNVLR